MRGLGAVTQELLGSRVVGVALRAESGLLGIPTRFHHAGQAEFGQLDHPVRSDQQAVGAQVAVDERRVLTVQVVHDVQKLVEIAAQHFAGQPLSLLGCQLLKGDAFELLQNQINPTPVLHDLLDSGQVTVL